MGDYFIGEIRIAGFNYAPQGWAECDGQVMNIQQNAALYSLLGVQFGGNGTTTFALPDLRGRTPLHRSAAYPQGQASGTESVALAAANMPSHTHSANGTTNNGTAPGPGNTVLLANVSGRGAPPSPSYVTPAGSLTPLHPSSVGSTGSGSAHSNMQPSLTLNFFISTTGIYPSRP